MIIADFTNCLEDTVTASGVLYQYDYNQDLKIQGLNIAGSAQVHFSFQQSFGESVRIIGEAEDGNLTVQIPNFLLKGFLSCQREYYIWAFVYVADSDAGETIKRIRIKVIARPRPKDYSEPEYKDALDQVAESLTEKLDKKQGTSNSGKFLAVGSDGNVVPADAPSGGSVDPEQIKQAVNGYLEENPPSGMTAEQEQQLNQNTTDVADLKSALEQIEDGGWTSTQIDLFEAFTNVIAYTSPDANSIVSSLISSLRSGSSDTPEGPFSIIYVLSNVTSSSKDNSIKSGEPYNTTLTASTGYELNSVIVKMGGSDITSTAYSDGEITISAVTGNIVITASAIQSSASGQLPQDGLVDYFDFRNKSYTAGGGGLYYINSDFGNGMLYSWSNQSSKQGDDIGIKGAAGNYTTERATGYPVTDNFPSPRTVCLFGKGGPSVPNDIGTEGTLTNSFLYRIKYISTDKSTKIFLNEQIQYPEGFSRIGYNASFVIVNQNVLKVYFDDTLHKTVDGNEIEDFESWDISPLKLTSFVNYGTAYAIYNKELSEVEIVEALEFFKTLEVSE